MVSKSAALLFVILLIILKFGIHFHWGNMNTIADLREKFEDVLNSVPHLVFEIGYTRPTGWMVHLWNSSGVGIGDAKKIFSIHDGDDGDFSKSIKEIDKFMQVSDGVT